MSNKCIYQVLIVIDRCSLYAYSTRVPSVGHVEGGGESQYAHPDVEKVLAGLSEGNIALRDGVRRAIIDKNYGKYLIRLQ